MLSYYDFAATHMLGRFISFFCVFMWFGHISVLTVRANVCNASISQNALFSIFILILTWQFLCYATVGNVDEENVIQCFYFTFQRFLIYFIYLFAFLLVVSYVCVCSFFSATVYCSDWGLSNLYSLCTQILAFDIHFWLYILFAKSPFPHTKMECFVRGISWYFSRPLLIFLHTSEMIVEFY